MGSGGSNTLVDKLRDGVNNIVGEASGSNFDRQQAYNKQVADNAAAAQADQIAKTNAANKSDDIAASSGAQGIRNTAAAAAGGAPGSSLTLLHFQNPTAAPNPDEQDFLGK